MQDIHSIGGGGQLFGGGGDRRVRPHHHQTNQALKCPRCDSANTKFCYYNNYNLSQPRHFCKACRRYWTKGGVLRNVPVGGGCRKAKRSKTKASSSDAPKEKKSNSNSSSESSSLTASNTAAPTASTAATGGAAPEVGSGSSSTSASTILNFPNSVFYNIPQSTGLSFDPPALIDHPSEGRIFPEIGSFTSMMTSATDQSQLGFEAADASASAYRINQEPDPEDPITNDEWGKHQKITLVEEMKMQAGGGFLDQTAEIDLSGYQSRGNHGGLGALDWQGGTDHGIFDLSGAVDQAYWSQTQWTDNDQSLYLP